MCQTSSIINDSFYSISYGNKITRKVEEVEHVEDDLIQRILPLIPKVGL